MQPGQEIRSGVGGRVSSEGMQVTFRNCRATTLMAGGGGGVVVPTPANTTAVSLQPKAPSAHRTTCDSTQEHPESEVNLCLTNFKKTKRHQRELQEI